MFNFRGGYGEFNQFFQWFIQMLVNETAMSLNPQCFFFDKDFWKKNMEDFHDSKTLNKQKSQKPKEKPMTLSKYIDSEDIFLYNAMGASFF